MLSAETFTQSAKRSMIIYMLVNACSVLAYTVVGPMPLDWVLVPLNA